METSPAHCGRTLEAELYVLGELKGYDLDAFARHLQTCDDCADEVDLLEVAGHAVPLLAARHIPVDPPEPRVERHTPILAAAAASAQAKAEQQATEQQQESGTPALRAIPGGYATSSPAAPVPSAQRAGFRTPRRLLRQPVPKPAAIAFVLIAVIGAVTIVLSNRAASIRYLHVSAGWTTGGGAAIKLEGDQAEVLVDGMPLPAAGTGYQIWVVNKATKRLTPTDRWLRPDRRGEAGANVPGNYHDLDAIAVYVEPLNGPDTTHSGAVVVADMRGLH